jgi:hypothetical protein
MAKQAPVFWGMVIGQRGHCVFGMALVAILFRHLLFHGHELRMIIVIGQVGGSFRRRIPEEEKKGGANRKKENVVKECFFSFLHGCVLVLNCMWHH